MDLVAKAMEKAASADLSRPLTDIWYFAYPAKDIRKGKTKRLFILGHPIAIGRTEDGNVFAVRDVCPHRAAPFSAGRQIVEGGKPCVECPYHGWRFSVDDGACAKIPALSEHDDAEFEKIRVPVFPVNETRGLIWIYIPSDLKRFNGKPALPAPTLPDGIPGDRPKTIITANAEGPYDEAVIGLVDPAHTPYVHQSWFWRDPGTAKEKEKNYEPSEYGFRMKAHTPASNGRAYKLIGGAATTEIEFRLPAMRLETIRNEKYTILGLTCITPTEEGKSLITQMFYWDMPLLSLIKPFAWPLGKQFLSQDGKILRLQNQNLELGKQSTMYVGEPDKLAQWYMAVKRAYLSGGPDGFEHPLSEATLRWRT